MPGGSKLDGPTVDRCARWCFLLILLSISAVGGAQDQGTMCGSPRLCVYTYGYDQSRDNVNPNETVLKASTLNSLPHTTSPDLKGIVYAQPLYMSSVTINGTQVNAVYVATEENWVYTLDSQTLSVLWSTNLNVGSETAVPDSVLPGGGCTNIAPEVGITGTPAIDPDGTTLFVVSKHQAGTTYTQRLNAVDIATGTKLTSLNIGTAIGSTLDALYQNQRAGLALVTQGTTLEPWIYVAWGSHCDGTPYNGIVASFQYSSGALTLDTVFYTESPTGSRGGIWMSGAAPAVTQAPESITTADVYLASGNGPFSWGQNWGESVLRLHHASSAISVYGSYTPNAWKTLNQGSGPPPSGTGLNLNLPVPYTSSSQIKSPGDMDLGSGGVTLARPAGSHFLPMGDAYSFVVLAGGKEGVFYDLNPSALNNSAADTVDPCSTGTSRQAVQCFGAIQLLGKSTLTPSDCCSGAIDYGNRGSTAFWGGNTTFQENVLYVAGSQDSKVRAWQMTGSGGGVFTTSTMFGNAPAPNTRTGLFAYPGASPVVSWNASDTVNGATNAILWILDTSGAAGSSNTTVAKLYAYSAVPGANGQFTSLWKDEIHGPLPTKFMVPTVLSGHVYVGGQSPNGTCAANSCLGRVVSWH